MKITTFAMMSLSLSISIALSASAEDDIGDLSFYSSVSQSEGASTASSVKASASNNANVKNVANTNNTDVAKTAAVKATSGQKSEAGNDIDIASLLTIGITDSDFLIGMTDSELNERLKNGTTQTSNTDSRLTAQFNSAAGGKALSSSSVGPLLASSPKSSIASVSTKSEAEKTVLKETPAKNTTATDIVVKETATKVGLATVESTPIENVEPSSTAAIITTSVAEKEIAKTPADTQGVEKNVVNSIAPKAIAAATTPASALEYQYIGGTSTIPSKKARTSGANTKSSTDTADIDAALASGATLSKSFVKNLINQALSYSPEIKSAQASSTAADYDIDQIKGQRWPQVTVGANTPLSNFGGGKKISNGSSTSDASASVSISTTLYDFGKTGSGIKSAEETSKASVQTIKLSRNKIAFDTLNTLLDLQRYMLEINVAKDYEARMSELVDMMSQITESDEGRGSELVQARAKRLQAKTNLDQLESKLRDTQIKMGRLVGHDVVVPTKMDWKDFMISASVAQSSLSNHPQLIQARAKSKAEQHQADAIKASKYPTVNWVVSKSSAKDEDGDQQAWYTGVNLEWKAFTGGSASASENAAYLRSRAIQMEYETTILELKYRINSIIQVRDSALERAKEYDALSAETDRVRKMFYEQWYYLGKRSLLDVLTAENDHFNNQISAINNEYDGYTANANVLAESSLLLGWLGMPIY